MPLDQYSDDPTPHQHCYHALRGIIAMVIPNGHTVQKCCKCEAIRTIHIDHANSWLPSSFQRS